ncbi:MAG: hypothetical protein ABI353_05375, partial [Isosphaeraceae bacterium]
GALNLGSLSAAFLGSLGALGSTCLVHASGFETRRVSEESSSSLSREVIFGAQRSLGSEDV